MGDDLLNVLVQRQMAQQQPAPATPPNPATKVPQQVKRFNNAQQIQSAYANGWAPNPVLLRATLGHR